MTADAEAPRLIHVALAEVFPTEADARRGIAEEAGHEMTAEYRGIRNVPEPYGALVHLFGDIPAAALVEKGWIQRHSA